MKSLQLTNQSTSLSPRDNEVSVAQKSPMIKDSDNFTLFEIFKNSITKAYLLIRYDSPSELALIIGETLRLALTNCPDIRENEINIAFTRGVLGEYGDFKGLSVVTFIGFLKSYLKDEERQRIIALSMVKPEEKKIPTAEEVFEMAKGNALKALNDVKIGRDITLSGSAVYDWLSLLGVISLSTEEKNESMDEAKSQLIEEYTHKNMTETDRFKRIDNTTIIDTLNSDYKSSQDVHKKLIRRAKTISLKYFLQGIIVSEENFDELIESKRSEYVSRQINQSDLPK